MSDNPSPLGSPAAEGSPPQPARRAPVELVLDTNVLLGLWLFHDPALQPLRHALAEGRARWHATAAMLDELALVAARPYPSRYQAGPELAEPPAHLVSAPCLTAPWRCRDPADQMFLDLAWTLQVPLWSRDRDLLCLRRRGALRGLRIDTPEAGQACLATA